MTEIEAAIGTTQLAKLNSFNQRRIELCNHLTRRLQNIEGVIPPIVNEDCKHVYYVYAIKSPHRDLLVDELRKSGIWFGAGYVKPLYQLPIYGGRKCLCPVTERIQLELMTTPICRPPATIEDMDKIADTIEEILNGN